MVPHEQCHSLGENTVKRLAFCALAVLLLVFVPGTAAAAPGATNVRRDYLDPTPPATAATAWVTRDIYLAAGNYRWEVVEQPDGAGTYILASRVIYLAAATYHWRCYADPGANNVYTLGCILDGPNGSAGVDALPQMMIWGNQYFTWGGWLTRL